MNTFKLYLVQLIFKIVPLSRFFKLKYFLLKWAGVKLQENARIYSNVSFFGNGEVEIGSNVFIGHQSILICSTPAKIIIGENVDIAPRVYIGTGSHVLDPTGVRMAGEGINKEIVIEDGVWIGANAVILPGVKIGKMSMVGAGSVVMKDVPEFTVVSGNPAKPIKKWCSMTNLWLKL
jgi:acetyltransferase-like isoleucine patch superfamily enzyme